MGQIISAVEYLHENGVVHCDLKPSNILVVEPICQGQEGSSELTVKVADFGLSQTLFQSPTGRGKPTGGRAGEGCAPAASGGDGDVPAASGGDGDVPAASGDDGDVPAHGHRGASDGASDGGEELGESRPKRLSAIVGTPNYWAPELVLLAQGDFAASKYDAGVDNWAVGCIVYELLVGQPPFLADAEEVLFYKITDATVDYPSYLSAHAKDLIAQLLRPADGDRLTCQEALRHPWLIS